MFQESCAQPEVTIFHLGRSSSFHRKTQRYYYVYSLRRSQDSAISLHYCSLTAFCKVREFEKVRLEKKKNETGTLQEEIIFSEVRRGSSQISEVLC